MMMRLMLVLELSTWALSFAQKPKPAEHIDRGSADGARVLLDLPEAVARY